MPKIVINEQDLTTTPLRVTNNNIVFIPGFYGEELITPVTSKEFKNNKRTASLQLKTSNDIQTVKIIYTVNKSIVKSNLDVNPSEAPSLQPGHYIFNKNTKMLQADWSNINDTIDDTWTLEITQTNKDAFLVCNNISEFEEQVGKTAQTANSDITYADINTALGSTYPQFASLKYKTNPDASSYTDADYTLPVNFMGVNAVDRSFVIAKELLNNGIPVLYYAVAGELNATGIANLYKKLIGPMPSGNEVYNGEIEDSVFYKLRGLGDYAVKYLTIGGYPSFGLTLSVAGENNAETIYNPLVDQMIYCSSRRGDCTVLVDGYNNPDGDHKDFYKAVKSYIAIIEKEMPTDITTGDPNGKDYIYGNREHIGRSSGNQGYISTAYSTATMIYPWIDVTMQLTTGEVQVPGSYAYLRALAQSIKQGSDWNAIAGVTRGQIPGFVRLCTNVPLTNTVADYMQPTDDVAINPITYIRPYGERIWGNRTLKNNAIAPEIGMEPGLTASSFLNIRNAVSDIKKQVYDACNSLMFEPNTDVLWINFQSKIQPLLDRMKSSEIFSGYKIIHNTSKYPYKLLATIVVYPVYAVEEFEITVQLSNEELIIEG